MRYLEDTNIRLRWAQPQHPLNAPIHAAVEALNRAGDTVCITAQNLIEFWNVSTRPVVNNGFGYTPVAAERELLRLEQLFPLLPDSAAIYPEWRRLVVAFGVSGVHVHDARLVAAMNVHGVTHILTLNEADFRRYSVITPVHPRQSTPQTPGS